MTTRQTPSLSPSLSSSLQVPGTPPPSSSLQVPGTPPPSSPLQVPGTPLRTDSRTMDQFDPKYEHRRATFQRISYDMSPYFVGPVPPQDFLNEFLPLTSPPPAPQDHIFTKKMFDALKQSPTEAAMYPRLVSDVGRFIPNLSLLNTANISDKVAASTMGFSSKPDCTVMNRDLVGLNPELASEPDYSCAELFIEFKLSKHHDPFKTAGSPLSSSELALFPEGVLMHLGKGEASQVLGQITTYAMLILGTQYRTHTFSVLIAGEFARLLRWDRSGVLVTERFPYNDQPYLFDFLFRYNYADSGMRGHDVTVHKSTPIEQREARAIVKEFEDVELLTVSMEQQDYVICAPCVRPDIPVGRWTRTSVAYLRQTKQRVFFKDSWRVLHPEITPEGAIYAVLQAANVPNIPGCLVRGDVGDISDVGDNKADHSTRTHIFMGCTLHPASKIITPYRHYHLVLDTVGRELTSFRCSKELVSVIRDSLIAHEAAVKAQVLHRDISPGNIMIVDDPILKVTRGMLIDWDHSKLIKSVPGLARQHARTGTWQFMASELIENPETPHTFVHDLESFFWVLIWAVVSYMRTDMSVEKRSSFLKTTMSPPVYGNRGGDQKRNYLVAKLVPEVQNNENIYFLLSEFMRFFAALYHSNTRKPPRDLLNVLHSLNAGNTGDEDANKVPKPERDADKADRETILRGLKDHRATISLFEWYLSQSGWPEDDGAILQEKVPSQDEKRGMLAGSVESRSRAEEIGVFVRSSTT